jgi:hypothetical protein
VEAGYNIPPQPCEYRCLGVKLGHHVTEVHVYRDLVLQVGVGRKADDHALQKNYCCDIQKVKTGCPNSQEWTNLAESSKEIYGSKYLLIKLVDQQ